MRLECDSVGDTSASRAVTLQPKTSTPPRGISGCTSFRYNAQKAFDVRRVLAFDIPNPAPDCAALVVSWPNGS